MKNTKKQKQKNVSWNGELMALNVGIMIAFLCIILLSADAQIGDIDVSA